MHPPKPSPKVTLFVLKMDLGTGVDPNSATSSIFFVFRVSPGPPLDVKTTKTPLEYLPGKPQTILNCALNHRKFSALTLTPCAGAQAQLAHRNRPFQELTAADTKILKPTYKSLDACNIANESTLCSES